MWARKNETQKQPLAHADGGLNCILMAKLLLLSKTSPITTSASKSKSDEEILEAVRTTD
jgi:hypothetical protein